MTPAQRELWVAVDANGIARSAEGDETAARYSAEALDERVPQRGPHRVQKYVVAERLTFTEEWYAARHERLSQLVREEGTPEFKQHWFSVVGNGTATAHEPPTYAQLLNTKQHAIDRMAHHIAVMHQLLGIRPSTAPRPEMEQHAERVLRDVVVASKENSLTSGALEAANVQLGADLEAALAALRALLTDFERLGRLLKGARGQLHRAMESVVKPLAARDVPDDEALGDLICEARALVDAAIEEARTHAGADVPDPDGA